ncbi:hypothetical protein ACXDF8_06695 [Mycolicibacterium sp. CBM1]
MDVTAQSTRRAGFVIGVAAILAMAGAGIAYHGTDVSPDHIANSVGYPWAPGPNGVAGLIGRDIAIRLGRASSQ